MFYNVYVFAGIVEPVQCNLHSCQFKPRITVLPLKWGPKCDLLPNTKNAGYTLDMLKPGL